MARWLGARRAGLGDAPERAAWRGEWGAFARKADCMHMGIQARGVRESWIDY